jgi:uncharacterized membrane protein YbhN (UPF0104 family)
MTARAIRSHLGTLAGAGILVLLLWRMGSGVFVDGLRRIDGTSLLAAVGLGLLTTVFSAWRWCLVARGLSIRLPLGRAVADYYRALFLNAALPGGILGDVHRAVRHGQDAGDIGRGVRAVFLERTAGQVVLIAVGVAILFAEPSPALAATGHLADRLTTAPGPALALAAVCALVVAAAVRLCAGPGTSRWRRAVRAALAEARLGLLTRRSWPGVLISSVAVLAGHLATFLLAARVAGSSAPSAQLMPLAVLALLAMGLPLNVGGWGPREGVTAWAFGAAGLGATQGLTVAVVYGVLTFAASLPGIVVLIGQWFAGLRRPQIDVEERVLSEGGASDRWTKSVPHHLRTGEAQPRDAVAEQDRCHGDVEPVQRPLIQKPRHGYAAALDEHPAQATPRERAQQRSGGERLVVRQDQHVDTVAFGNGRQPTLTSRAHHPQGGC